MIESYFTVSNNTSRYLMEHIRDITIYEVEKRCRELAWKEIRHSLAYEINDIINQSDLDFTIAQSRINLI